MKNQVRFVRPSALALAIASAFPACALAQAAPSLNEVIVTSSRTEQRIQDSLPSATLITREDIDRAQVNDLPTLLQRVAGVQVTQNGGPGTVAGAFVRGAESRHTLVLIDGVPVNNLNFNTAAIEHLSLDNVDRIEVVRGNVSALYGSAALGGVIQIFTRGATRTPQASVRAQVGARNLRQLNASGAVRLDSGTSINASVEELRNGGFNATNQTQRPGTNPDIDGYERRSIGAGIVQEIGNSGSTVGLRVREARGTTRYDSQFGPATQRDESAFAERGATLEGRFKLGSDLTLTALASTASDHLDGNITAFPYFVNSRSRGGQLGVEWQIVPGQRLTAGYETMRQRIVSDTVYTRTGRDLSSARAGWQGDFGNHQLQLNLRQDKYNDFGGSDTYFAGYAYRITPEWRVNVSKSTGFMAPTFNDLFNPFGGNVNLRPERLKSTELGLQYAAAGHEVRATLFKNQFTDLIANDVFFNRVNVARASNNGLELTYTGRFGSTLVNAGATRQDPVDDSTGARLTRRASTLANLGVSWGIGPWNVGGDLRFTGSRPDGVRTLKSYSVVDLTASYAIGKQVKLFGRIENLLDKDYQTVYGYNQPGRGLFAGLSWQL